MNIDYILKVLQKSGGYPNKKVNTILSALDISGPEFLKGIVDRFGKEGAEKFFTVSLKRLSEKNGKFTFHPYSHWVSDISKESYMNFDFSDATVEIEDPDDLRYISLVIDNAKLIDSKLNIESEDGEMHEWSFQELLDAIWDDDPYQYEDAKQEWWSVMKDSIKDELGVRISSLTLLDT